MANVHNHTHCSTERCDIADALLVASLSEEALYSQGDTTSVRTLYETVQREEKNAVNECPRYRVEYRLIDHTECQPSYCVYARCYFREVYRRREARHGLQQGNSSQLIAEIVEIRLLHLAKIRQKDCPAQISQIV